MLDETCILRLRYVSLGKPFLNLIELIVNGRFIKNLYYTNTNKKQKVYKFIFN